MPKDLTINLDDPAGSLAVVGEALGVGGKNTEGGFGFLSGGKRVFHLLVQDAHSARRVLEASKIPVSEERDVLVIIADAGEKTITDLSGVETIGPDVYVLKVPDNGSARITTRIQASEKTDDTQDPLGCSHIIVGILRRLRRLIK